jgi:inner membrane protein involved in colicin E2 resistance
VGVGDEGLAGYAIANAVSSLLTAFFGARCLRNPTRGFLGTSAAFAVLNVVWGVIQVANGASHWLFYATIVAAALAGVMSFVARDTAATEN